MSDWRGPWQCETCGHQYTHAQGLERSLHCTASHKRGDGVRLVPFDRRAPNSDNVMIEELRKREKRAEADRARLVAAWNDLRPWVSNLADYLLRAAIVRYNGETAHDVLMGSVSTVDAIMREEETL